MPNFVGSITIDSMTPVSDTGTPLGAPTFANVDPSVAQVIAGATTLFNTPLTVAIYDATKVPKFERALRFEALSPLADGPPDPKDVPVCSEDDTSSTTGAWAVTVPANTLTKATTYLIKVSNADDTVSDSQDMNTA